MKAVQINAYGGNEVLEVNENAPKPSVSQDQILIEVHAASINPFDSFMLRGGLKGKVPLSLPITLGGDFAGVVTEVGEEVNKFKKGDKVYGSALILAGGSGSFAQFAQAGEETVALKPKNIDFPQAASLPLVGVSALQVLENHIKLKKGQKILIHGGAGGIGSIAVQLAKALGAYIATTVSTKDMDFARNLGADEVIDYKQSFSSNKNEVFEDKIKDFDAVFTTVGGEIVDKSFATLKKGGILVSMLGQPSEELAKKHGIVAIAQVTKINTEDLNRLAKYVESSKIKPQIDKVFPIEQAKEAFRHLEEGHPQGKVVLKIK